MMGKLELLIMFVFLNLVFYGYTWLFFSIFKGIYDIQGNTRNGQRCSTAKAYLVPAETRENLDIITNAMVKKVSLFNFQFLLKINNVKLNIFLNYFIKIYFYECNILKNWFKNFMKIINVLQNMWIFFHIAMI